MSQLLDDAEVSLHSIYHGSLFTTLGRGLKQFFHWNQISAATSKISLFQYLFNMSQRQRNFWKIFLTREAKQNKKCLFVICIQQNSSCIINLQQTVFQGSCIETCVLKIDILSENRAFIYQFLSNR